MLRTTIPLFFGLVAAGSLSQFPEFAQQYTQRVGGAYTELHEVANGLRQDAANNGKTVSQAIDEYAAADSAFFRDRGESITGILEREVFLEEHYASLTGGEGFAQLMTFAKKRDLEIAQETLNIYKPAVPATFTGVSHAALGFLAGFFALRSLFIFRRRRKSVPV